MSRGGVNQFMNDIGENEMRSDKSEEFYSEKPPGMW